MSTRFSMSCRMSCSTASMPNSPIVLDDVSELLVWMSRLAYWQSVFGGVGSKIRAREGRGFRMTQWPGNAASAQMQADVMAYSTEQG
jgi:hypothetical protein